LPDQPYMEVTLATLTQDVIRTLAGFQAQETPVVSLYLDVDGRRFVRPKDYELHLDHLLKEAAGHTNGHKPAACDLERIETHVKSGIDRSRTRGLAIFSCQSQNLWKVFELPVPVRNQLVVNGRPHVRQLETVVDQYERFGVLLADKQRARMFVFELGELVDKSELFDQLPRHEDDKGDWDRDHVRDHTNAAAHRHLKRSAEVAFHVFQEQGFDHLIIGAPEETSPELERVLHPYLRERIAARVNVPVGATEATIRAAALDVEQEVERTKDARLVARLKDAAATPGGLGVEGLEKVLTALGERRVDTLLVSEGFETEGWRCPSCGWLTVKGPSCPMCSSQMELVEDVVEAAVEEAIAQSCKVCVCIGNADLDVHGRIGALLRF
jgi:peptide chain release factor subunit 1